MSIIFAYIKPILFFVILESLILNLISDGAFKKLAKLFCGFVLILLVLVPIGKTMGVMKSPGDFLKDAQLEQSIKQCEDMMNYSDKYLTDKYSEEYKKIVKENIEQIAENEGMMVTSCDISIDMNEEIEIKKIVLVISEKEKAYKDTIDVYTDIMISVTEDNEKISEAPEILKIRNGIAENYHVDEENILIRRTE